MTDPIVECSGITPYISLRLAGPDTPTASTQLQNEIQWKDEKISNWFMNTSTSSSMIQGKLHSFMISQDKVSNEASAVW